MAKCSYETYTVTRPVLCLTAQTAVECKLMNGSEFAAALGVRALAVPTGKEVLSGEFRYTGKLVFSVVYEDADGQIRRIERGAEFTQSIENPSLAPSYTAKLGLNVLKTTLRRENGNVSLVAIVAPTAEIYAPKELRYLADTDLIARREEIALSRAVRCSGMAECEDEFETDYLSDVLLHSEQIFVERAETGSGYVLAEGQVALLVTVLRGGTISSFERMVPFRAEIPCDEALPNLPVCAGVALRNAKLDAATDEEKGKSSLVSEFTLEFFCTVWEKSYLPAVTDAFSQTAETECVREREELSFPAKRKMRTERIAGTCACSATLDFSTSVQAILSAKAEGKAEGGTLSGVVTASAVLADKDGFLKQAELTLPFSLPEEETGEAELLVCGLRIAQRNEGELEAEATLKIGLVLWETERTERIVECREGEPLAEPDAAISVYLPEAGDGLWETAKRLGKSPEEVTRLNPDLTFPLSGTERIVVYRKKEVSF